GIVARAVPGWERIRNRPQRSAVHRFTVDRHQIETVLEAQRLLPRVSRPDLLLLAALLHDLGKHAGSRDHAADGAPLAEAAALHLGCEEDDARLIAALVREHLTLVDLATGRDLADPATLRALLDAVDEDLGPSSCCARSPRPTRSLPGRRPGPPGAPTSSTTSPTSPAPRSAAPPRPRAPASRRSAPPRRR